MTSPVFLRGFPVVGFLPSALLVCFGLQARGAVADASRPDDSDAPVATVVEDFVVQREGERLRVTIMSPPAGQLASRPLLLLNFATDRQTSLTDKLYGAPAQMFIQHGHRVASFDVPAHGERVGSFPQGIEGLCARFVAGQDPFKLFVGDGQAVIDECIRRNWAESGRIVVCGNSRSAYQAMRLMAADRRILAAAGLAPVTDWRILDEFAAVKGRADVAALALDRYAAQLAGRRVYLALGNGDRRVGTDALARFALALFEEEARHPPTNYHLKLVIADDSPGHTLADRWSDEGTRFLLQAAE